jgi:hypothetical protein
MKNLKAILGILIAIGILTNCSKSEKKQPLKNSDEVTVNTRTNAAAFSFVKSENGEALVDELNKGKLLGLIKKMFKTDENVSKVFNFSFQKGNNVSYLIFEGFDGSVNRIKKYALGINMNYSDLGAADLNGAVLIEKETHKCEGAPCSCCEFVKNGDTIVGCNCWNPDPAQGNLCAKQDGQKCNHTVSTATDAL